MCGWAMALEMEHKGQARSKHVLESRLQTMILTPCLYRPVPFGRGPTFVGCLGSANLILGRHETGMTANSSSKALHFPQLSQWTIRTVLMHSSIGKSL
jgi:hypothetical protein